MPPTRSATSARVPQLSKTAPRTMEVKIFTDGACQVNPGPGGWAAILRYGHHEKRLAGGVRYTTNNRMELRAVIEAFKALKRPGLSVHLVSDSRYVIDTLNRGRLRRWVAQRFRKGVGRRENADLWMELVPFLKQHRVSATWVRGHGSDPDNVACDHLAVQARQERSLPEDSGYADPRLESPKAKFFARP